MKVPVHISLRKAKYNETHHDNSNKGKKMLPSIALQVKPISLPIFTMPVYTMSASLLSFQAFSKATCHPRLTIEPSPLKSLKEKPFIWGFSPSER